MLKGWMLLITERIVCRCGSIIVIISSGTLILVVGLFFCVILRHMIHQEVDDDQQAHYGHHLGHHFIFYKHQWGGIPNTHGMKMPHPVGLVIISHTNSSSCQTFTSCAKTMRKLEKHEILKGLWGICFNFAIAGNGDIYVGRGWDTINCFDHLSIGISFIGNFNVDVVNFNMTHAARALLQQGISLGMLSEDYILVGHNQSSKLHPNSPAGVKSRSRCHCFKPVLLILNLHWIVIRNTLIAGIFLFVVIVTVLVIVKTTGSKTNEITFQDPFYNGSLGNHSVIYRKQWGGVPPKSTPIRLKHPVDTLIVSCSLKDFCNTSDTCASAVRNLQKSHQSVRRFPDVGYNFMIGGDGGIYVGTGWDYRNFHRKTSIGIDFLGNFVYDKLSEDMIDAFHQLVHQGLMLKKLSREYKLVGENQTDPTVYLSPGPNVIKFMETWPHFYNKTWF